MAVRIFDLVFSFEMSACKTLKHLKERSKKSYQGVMTYGSFFFFGHDVQFLGL